MKSIFLLCEYRIPYNTVQYLDKNGVTIEQIINNANCLNSIVSDNKKILIISSAKKVAAQKEEHSVYDLTKYGLSKNIADKLYNKKIRLEDIDDTIKEKYHIGESTFTKIVVAIEEFSKNNNYLLFIEKNSFMKIIMNSFSHYPFSINQIESLFKEQKCNLRNIERLLFMLVEEGKIVKEQDFYKIPPSIFELEKYGLSKNIIENTLLANSFSFDDIDNLFDLDLIIELKLACKKIQNAEKDNIVRHKDMIKEIIQTVENRPLLKEEVGSEGYSYLGSKEVEKISKICDVHANISNSSRKKILNAYKEMMKDLNIKKVMSEELLLRIIKRYSLNYVISRDCLRLLLSERNYDVNGFEELINNMITSNLVIEIDQGLRIPYPHLEQEIKKLKERERDFLTEKLKGKTLEEIGKDNNLTRERVRQIVRRAINKIEFTQEDSLRETFEKYKYSEKIFCELYSQKKEVYYYLKEKYLVGKEEPINLLYSKEINEKQKEILMKAYHIIEFRNMLIDENKYELVMAILKTSEEQMTVAEIKKEYNSIIVKNNYKLPKIEESRLIEAYLDRQDNILFSNNRRYRYFEFDLLEKDEIKEILEVLDVPKGMYYVDYFFDNNLKLMKKIGVRDKGELYNLLKKLNKSNEIIFLYMPTILIGYKDKNQFIEDKIFEWSPISLEEFTMIMEEDYGINHGSFRNFLSVKYAKYIRNGKISADFELIPIELLAKIRGVLTEKLYLIEELKEILDRILNEDSSKFINNYNLNKLGYKIRENYIIDNNCVVEDAIRELLLKDEIVNLKDFKYKKIGSTYYFILIKCIERNELIRFDNNENYYTLKKLKKMNIESEDIEKFKKHIQSCIQENQVFNVFKIKKDGLLKDYNYINLNDIFVESIVKTIKGIQTIGFNNEVLFIKNSNEQFTKKEMINKIITSNKISSVWELREYLKTNLNLFVKKEKITPLIDIDMENFDLRDSNESVVIIKLGKDMKTINM